MLKAGRIIQDINSDQINLNQLDENTNLYVIPYKDLINSNLLKKAKLIKKTTKLNKSQKVKIPGIDELKFRASYGTAGNRPQFGYRFETLNADGTKNTLGNEDLKSSLQREIEVGLDTRLWDRLNASVSYSRSVRSDLFHELPLAGALANPADWEAIISKQQDI